jgi:hypothetical protein
VRCVRIDFSSLDPWCKEFGVRLLFTNNDGGGLADHGEVAAAVTVAAFLSQRLPGRPPEDYLICVNRLAAAADHALRHGDRVTITTVKMEGAKP